MEASVSRTAPVGYVDVMDGTESSLRAEQEIIDAARAGETDAVALLYDRHHQSVRAFARRILNDDTLAEDLVHDVFVSLPKALKRFQGNSQLRTFILGITANQAKHSVRSAMRRRNAYARYAKKETPPPPDPEALAHQKELAEALERAMDTLPYKHRVAFVLCDVEERTSKEAAEILGIPPATVRTRVFHARLKLRKYLESERIR